MKLINFLPLLCSADTVQQRLDLLEQRVEQLERQAEIGQEKASFSYGLYYCQDGSIPGIDPDLYNFKGKGRIPLDYQFYDSMFDRRPDYAGKSECSSFSKETIQN